MKLLVTGAWQCTEEELSALSLLGHEIIFMKDEKDALPDGAEKAEGIICNGLFLNHDIEKFENLRYIQLTSAGFDRVPMDYVKKQGIKINNARGVYSIPMAEFAFWGVLELLKNGRFFKSKQKEHKWEKNREISELFGKGVLILGCGSVGTECAKRFEAFGCKVTGIDLVPLKNDSFKEILGIEKLDCVLPEADILVLTLPLTEETHHIISGERLSEMKSGAIIVNIARGKIVDTDGLLKCLDENLGGAVLDVFEEEPLSSHSPLWDKDNVIITPHNSFVGGGNGKRLFDVIVKNIENE